MKARVRRVTYELGPISEDDGSTVRQYPWEPGRPSNMTCYLTDAEWQLEDLKRGETLDRMPMDTASFRVRPDGTELNRLDLMIDFVPVIHITNTIPEGGEHWGRSAIARVLQGLDELAATDSDSSAASATTGTPIIALSGARLPLDRATGKPEQLKVEAGAVWQLGDSGRMDALDTSPQLAELRSRAEHLLDRIASNSRITAVGLGTLDASEVPSGYAFKLALAPLDALVGAMRLAREHKYRLLFKFVQRLYQAGRAEGWTAGESFPARLAWAPHTPTSGDEQEHNALHLEEAGAAVALVGERANARELRRALEPVLTSRERRGAMAKAARTLGKPDAAMRLAELLLSVALNEHHRR
ncbi:hypothetical protein [Streptomyces jeddahensis]|uniref:hypothetical protein n=1 Tax=Streptomyces jeddahensis TaxID=1716141 RepID=UPI0012FF8655|nr:hypothetical protein [Streptomyces jeddahensis]